jgi:PhzF family phenazine biosynthesis protein
MEIERLAAFSDGNQGGNPAGVAICERLPDEAVMQGIAAEVGFSETAFAAPWEDGWRVRYFAPAMEGPFCGHATIALGVVLARRFGEAVFPLILNDTKIVVEGRAAGGSLEASLQSPPTRNGPASDALVDEALTLFSYQASELDWQLPPTIIQAGARHLMLALSHRDALTRMAYDLVRGRSMMRRWSLTTIALVHRVTPTLFQCRNAFAAGGVVEDPATGAAAAALAGFLRDSDRLVGQNIRIVQGEDMGMRSVINAEAAPDKGGSVRVSGQARFMEGNGPS